MTESEGVEPVKAPRLTCQLFLGVLASQKSALSEKELHAAMSRSFPRHCDSLPKTRNPLQVLYRRLQSKLRIASKLSRSREGIPPGVQRGGLDGCDRLSGRRKACTTATANSGAIMRARFPWLWAGRWQFQSGSTPRVCPSRCNSIRTERAQEQARLLDPLEASIPHFDKAPRNSWFREECVQFTHTMTSSALPVPSRWKRIAHPSTLI